MVFLIHAVERRINIPHQMFIDKPGEIVRGKGRRSGTKRMEHMDGSVNLCDGVWRC